MSWDDFFHFIYSKFVIFLQFLCPYTWDLHHTGANHIHCTVVNTHPFKVFIQCPNKAFCSISGRQCKLYNFNGFIQKLYWVPNTNPRQNPLNKIQKKKKTNLQLAHKFCLSIHKFHNKPFTVKCLYLQMYKRESFSYLKRGFQRVSNNTVWKR